MLVEYRAAAEYCAVLDGYISYKEEVIGNNNPVVQGVFMTKMDPNHQKVVIPNCFRAPFLRPSMDRHIFQYDIVTTHFCAALRTWLEIKVLGLPTNDRPITHGIPISHPDMATDNNACLSTAVIAHNCSDFNHGLQARPQHRPQAARMDQQKQWDESFS